MDLGIVMRGEVLQDKRAEGRAGRAVATWNTRRLPTRMTPGWTNRLFVACAGVWRGYFPLSGDILWNPAGRDRALCPHPRPASLDAQSDGASTGLPWKAIS